MVWGAVAALVLVVYRARNRIGAYKSNRSANRSQRTVQRAVGWILWGVIVAALVFGLWNLNRQSEQDNQQCHVDPVALGCT